VFFPVRVFRRTTLCSATLAALLFPSLLQAAPLSQGSFGIAGSFAFSQGSTLATTDGLFFGSGSSFLITSPGSFDLAGVGPYGATVTLRDVPAFSPLTSVTSFVTAGNGTTVNLRSFNVALQNATFLNFFGEVDLLAPGFDLTPGVMSGTATTINAGTAALALTFAARPSAPPAQGGGGDDEEGEDTGNEQDEEETSAGDEAARVPEPWSVGVLGLGLTALAMIRRRRKSGA
jgi:hypothetical protein